MRLGVLLGSARPQGQSAKVMQFVRDRLGREPDIALEVVDPCSLPLVIPGPSAQEEGYRALCGDLQARLKGVAGILMISPEYDGTISAVTKLLLEYLGYPSVLAGKPAAIVGVAGGRTGAYRSIEHLRSTLTHIGCLVLPQTVSMASAYSLFDQKGALIDKASQRDLEDAMRCLIEVSRRGTRES